MESREDKITHQIIAIASSAFLVWMIYFGSYLPWQKSKVFIATLQGMDRMRSVSEVQDAFDVPFNIPSPIGQEEIVRHFASTMLSAVQRFSPEQVPASLQVINYVDEQYSPIMERGRGMSFGQNLFVLGSLNQIIFMQTKDPKYLAMAEKYFTTGNSLAPKRPQFLYGLFDLYRISGNTQKATETVNKILALWPEDEGVKKALDDFLAKKGAIPNAKKSQ